MDCKSIVSVAIRSLIYLVFFYSSALFVRLVNSLFAISNVVNRSYEEKMYRANGEHKKMDRLPLEIHWWREKIEIDHKPKSLWCAARHRKQQQQQRRQQLHYKNSIHSTLFFFFFVLLYNWLWRFSAHSEPPSEDTGQQSLTPCICRSTKNLPLVYHFKSLNLWTDNH